jgi:hypothetical protein
MKNNHLPKNSRIICSYSSAAATAGAIVFVADFSAHILPLSFCSQ